MTRTVEIPSPLAARIGDLAATIKVTPDDFVTALLVRYLAFHTSTDANDPTGAFRGSIEAESIQKHVAKIHDLGLPAWLPAVEE